MTYISPGYAIGVAGLGIASLIPERFALAATAITAYDPEYDEGEKAVKAAVDVIRELAKLI